MTLASFSLRENYWEDFKLQEEDITFLYTYLMELETPLTSDELIEALVENRIEVEKEIFEEKRLNGGDVYTPAESYQVGQKLVFPVFDWRQAEVIDTRSGKNPEMEAFSVVRVAFDDTGEEREFAADLSEHSLNQPKDTAAEDVPQADAILEEYRPLLRERLEQGLQAKDDFVRIAGRWFPRALLVDVNKGHLNLAEAVLDMAEGEPLPTSALLEQVDLPSNENPKLLEFSLDLALQEDNRFDEVGPAGKIRWYLRRLEPEGVSEVPLYLRYHEIEYDRDLLSDQMIGVEQAIEDELTPYRDDVEPSEDEVAIPLLFPHWRAGALPLTPRVSPFFPTAYEAPRIRFILVDGENGEKFPGWVVRKEGYVLGLKDWYRQRELMPGTIVRVRPGEESGEVVVQVAAQRSRRDWVRTALVGADGGIVFATLKQVVTAAYNERMGIMVPSVDALDEVWERPLSEQPPFERVVANMARELTKLNPQNHVHVTELYAAVNLVRRCPPGPIMALLTSRPWFVHVGDLHFRFDDSAG